MRVLFLINQQSPVFPSYFLNKNTNTRNINEDTEKQTSGDKNEENYSENEAETIGKCFEGIFQKGLKIKTKQVLLEIDNNKLTKKITLNNCNSHSDTVVI